MAHTIRFSDVDRWQSVDTRTVTITERGCRLKGTWQGDIIGNTIVVRNDVELRTYTIRERVSATEYRATLVDTIQRNKGKV